ncbi:MAG: dTDP-4-dehydrorhamnose reductase [Bacteroidales bacterium]
MKRILVTGAEGQLGQSLQDIISDYPDFDVSFTDVEDLDLLDTEAVEQYLKEYQPDVIINCAAYTAVDQAESDEQNAMRLNADVPEMLGSLAAEKGIRLVHISTDYVFDGKANTPYTETQSTAPVTVYGRSKREGEQRLLAALNDALILRTSWLYSPYGKNFLKTMLRLGSEKEQLKVVQDQLGSPTWAGHLANGILHIISRWVKSGVWLGGIYHFSNQGVCSWYDFAWQIMYENSLDCHIHPVGSESFPTSAKRPHYSVLDKTAFEKDFHFIIPHWQTGLRECLNEM